MNVLFRIPNKGTASKPFYPNPSQIYIRFGSGITPSRYLVNPDYWTTPKRTKNKSDNKYNPRKIRPKSDQGLTRGFKSIKLTEDQRKKGLKSLSKATLSEIETFIYKADEVTPKNIDRDSAWLKKVVREHHGIKDPEDSNYLDEYFAGYILKLPELKPTLSRFLVFQESTGKRYELTEINADFSKVYSEWLFSNENKAPEGETPNTRGLMPGYIKIELGRFRSVIKKVALTKGIKRENLDDWYKIKDKPPAPITLDWDEIDKLYNLDLSYSPSLNNLRAVLLISCYTALRYSDVYKVKEDLIKKDTIDIEVKKTDDTVHLPIHPRVKEILSKTNIYPVSLTYYDLKIKEVCRLAGINDLVKGRKIGSSTEIFEEEKWNFCASHMGRRSFATNHFGEIPTPFIMACTGHTLESTFMKYIGKKSNFHVKTFQDYWNKQK